MVLDPGPPRRLPLLSPALDQRLRRKLALMSASTSGADSAASSWLTLSQPSVSLLELGLCQILTGGQNMEYYFK